MRDALSVPDDQDFLDQFGDSPQMLDEPWIRKIDIATGNGNLSLSYDTHACSIEFEWRQDENIVWHCLREEATALELRCAADETHIVATFAAEHLSSEIDVRVYPMVSIHDSSLRIA